MAVATGKLSAKDAEKYFSRSNDKTRSVQATVDKYKAAQSTKPIAKVPEKTVHLMVKTEAIVVDAGACPLPAPTRSRRGTGRSAGGGDCAPRSQELLLRVVVGTALRPYERCRVLRFTGGIHGE